MRERLRGLLASHTVISAAYLIFGLILLFRPALSGKVICGAVGIGALVYGVVKLVSFWKLREMGGVFQLELVLGVVFAAIGIFALVRADVILSILPIMLGIILLMDCVTKLQSALQLRRMAYGRWVSVLAAGLVTGAAGVVLLVNPFTAATVMIRFIGAGLIVDGLTQFWTVYCLSQMEEF